MAIVNANALIAGAGGTSNYCPNQTRVGIVAGTPGVLPTAHGFIGATSGLTQQVVGQGADPVTGLPYYDVRLYGITTGTFLIPCFNNTAAYNTIVGGGVTQTFSVWAALVGGSLANVTSVGLQFRFNGGLPAVSAAQPITLTSSLTQFTQTAASTTGTVSVNSGLIFSWLVGAAIDMTLRFGPQQHEIGTGPTAQISPPAGTVALVTRALQVAPDVRAPPGIVYATCTIYGTGGVAVPATGLTWIATTRATIPGAGGTTNYAPNPRLEGVVPGTPGTFPTSTGTSALGGLSTTVVGSGIDVTTGLPYFDVRFFGVSTQGFVLYYPIANAPWFNVPVASATWTFSTWVALVGGSLTNVSTNFLHQIRWNNGTPGLANFSFTPNATFTQYTTTGTSGTGTTTTQTDISLSCTIGQPVDLTLRFGPSQLELGSARTPQIWPPVGTPGWSARALLAAPDVLGPPGIQYANCTIYGAGGFAFNPVNSKFLAAAQINGTGGQTNWVRNPLSEGLIAGTPGTIPTFWQAWSTNGLNRDLSLQIINGEPFTVTRWYGNTNVSGGITAFVENQSSLPLMPLANGQTITFSVDLAIIAGSHPGPLFFTIGGVPCTSNFTAIGIGFQNDITAPLIATTTPRRYSVTYTANDPTTAYVRFNILPIRGATLGQAIDVTLAIGYPQAEYGPVPTGVILPPPGAPGFATRPLLAAPVQFVSAACTINGTGGIATAEQVGLVAANLSTETGMVWDPASILDPVNTTLSSDNRTVLHTDPTTSNFDGVRGILPPLGAGKYYAEFTPPGGGTSWTASCSIGVCNVNANYHSLYDTAANGCVFQPLYGIWVNGVDTGLLHNAWLNNETAAMAVDLDNERIWFRVLPSGLWNGTPGADPTIPSTGIDLSSIPLLQFDAFAEVNLANRSVEINAGSEPFRGAVPAGFVSWPAPGHVQATPRLLAAAVAEADGVGTLRATAVVRAAAGVVTIAGGEGNRLDQRTIPVPGISYTVVVSTDIPPPPGVYTPVYLHTSISTADNAIGGVFTTNPTPFIPYRWGAWLYVPSSWTGVNILFQVEGAGTTAVQGFVSLATRDQWQYVTFETDAVANNNARLVCRGTTNPGGTLYTAGWTGIPDTVVGGAVSRETSVSRIAGTGGVIASAQVLAAARSTLPGVGGHLNFIRNPLHLGAVVGTPGTLPTFWTISLSGISQQVVGTGIDAATGLPYLDVRFFGTTSAGSSNIRFEAQIGGVPATNGETWTQSVYVMLAGGSLTNINGIGVQLYQTSATGVILGNTGATTVPVPVGALGRIVRSGTIATPGTLFNWPVLNLYHATPQPIDITLRLAGEQLELGSVATGVVQPPAGTTGFSSFGILNDARVLVSAACTIAGNGAIATAEQVGLVAARFDGVGALQASPFEQEPARATISGVGSLSANAGPLAPTGAILVGTGALFADPRPARPGVATLSGAGSFAADATPRKAASGLIVGVGQLTASAWELAQASATLAGISDFDADGIRIAQTYPAGATFAGTGSLVATVTAGGGAAALIAGTGSVLGAAVSRLLTQANVSGISSLVVDGAGWRPGLARMAGLGSLRADAHPARAARSTIPGQGGVTNWVRNPRGDNPALGTYAPGVNTTTPPWWDTDVNTGLQRQLIGNFTVDGVDVLRMRAWGTPDPSTDPAWAIFNAIFEYTPEYTPGVGFLTGVAEGQTYTRSFYLRLVDGSWTNLLSATFWGVTSGRTGSATDPRTLITPLPGNTLTRYTDTVTVTGGTPPYQVVGFGLTVQRVDPPGPIDITFDIGGGQIELGPLTGLILPQPGQIGASTRALQAAPFALVSAAAHISGNSSVTVGAATQERAAARIGGEGWLVAAAYSPAQQVVSGEGNFVAISSQIIMAAGARLDGVGLVRAAGYSGVSYARARIDGSSDCWAEDYWLTSQPVTRLHGVGQLSATANAHLIAGAAPTAISHLSADAMPTVFVGVRLWPEGNLIARPVAQLGGAAKLGGEGTLNVRGLASLTSARLAGVGRLIASATTVGAVYTAARLAGLGQLQATANAPVHAAARLAGVGQFGADGTVAETSGIHHGAALLAGIGHLVGRVPGRVQAAATIPGVGHLAASTVAHLIAGSAPTAISHLWVDLSQVFPAIMVGARIWPEGKLVAIAGPTRAAAAAQLAGVGTLRARADAERILAVTLGGEGSLAADAITVPPAPPVTLEAAALIAGEGAFPADHPWDDELLRDGTGLPPIHVLAGAFAQIRGIGHLVAGNSPQTLHAAALIGGEGRLTDFRGGGIYDEAALGGTVNVKRSLAGVMRGTVALTGRLRAGAVLAGVVQGDQEK
jgi:hypothetical protein